jgi:thiosulfate/3-mercaptopyruvate sulfurtransferase
MANPDSGRAAYEEGHIPGALHADLDDDLAGKKTGHNGRHPLPAPHTFMAWLGKCGLKPDDHIVTYDDSGAHFAARLWWMLRWVGHESVSVLDGGYTAWVKAGLPVTSEKPLFRAMDYNATVNESLFVDISVIETNLDSRKLLVIDARGANRYAGREEPIDPVAGHIPHALNRPCTDNLTADMCFKSPEQLKNDFQSLLGSASPDQVIHQCGSGVTACHNLLAMEVAGLHGSRLYAGSWSEWCSDPHRPVATES